MSKAWRSSLTLRPYAISCSLTCPFPPLSFGRPREGLASYTALLKSSGNPSACVMANDGSLRNAFQSLSLVHLLQKRQLWIACLIKLDNSSQLPHLAISCTCIVFVLFRFVFQKEFRLNVKRDLKNLDMSMLFEAGHLTLSQIASAEIVELVLSVCQMLRRRQEKGRLALVAGQGFFKRALFLFDSITQDKCNKDEPEEETMKRESSAQPRTNTERFLNVSHNKLGKIKAKHGPVPGGGTPLDSLSPRVKR